MSYDGFVTGSVVHELCQKILGGKIDKIYQPEKDEIVLGIRTFGGKFRLLLSANPSNARVHLSDTKKENPMAPPMLCMLMRKYLSGGKIVGISQPGRDRVVRIDVECLNELGDFDTKSVITEIMGRHSNIIFIDKDGKIYDSAKHVDFTVSKVRQILPGLMYEPPPAQHKISSDDFELVDFMNELSRQEPGILLDKFLLDHIVGMSPLIARELVYRFSGHTNVAKSEVDEAKFVTFVGSFIDCMKSCEFSPCVVYEKQTGKPVAFSCITINQYGNIADVKSVVSMSDAIDEFYQSRSIRESMHRRSSDILKLVNNNMDRCSKKLALHMENLEKSKDRDKYKIKGDLITANMHKLQYGMDEIVLENFYDNNKEIKITLDPTLSPAQNAQKFYKRYSKAKATEKYASEQIKDAEEELEYLETILESIHKAESPGDLGEIKEELREEGYIKNNDSSSKKRKPKNCPSGPMKFISGDGYEILVGRNNKQNDELTVRMSYSTDIWLHTKEIPGSHVLIRTNGTGVAPENTILEAARLAAYFSKARESAQVPVDYTNVKNVRKPNGAKPGYVVYKKNKTLYVAPMLLDH